MDFDSEGKAWSVSLANLDSDGDGRTNGEELQDPTGSWTEGSPNPGNSSLVTNPSVFDNFPDPTVTNTPIPEPTNTPTETQTSVLATATPTDTAGPTETESPEPTETETAEPTETPEITATRTPGVGGGEVEVRGTLGSLNLGEGTLIVGGILVRTNENTEILDDDNEPIELADLKDGDFVEVEGLEQEDGSILASKIKLDDDGGSGEDCETEFTGTISEIDLGAGVLVVDGQTVLTDASTVLLDDDNLPVGLDFFQIGQTVEVKGTPQEDASILACRIKPEDNSGDDDDDDDDDCEEEFEGVISEINPASMTLVVGNVLLKATSATEILDHDRNPINLSLLSVGDLVEVKYCPTAGVPPLAERIKLEDGDNGHSREFEVEGFVDALDLNLTSLTVNGSLIFATGASVREADGPEIQFSDLMVGDFVKVKGFLLADSTIQATRIVRKDEDDSECESKVRGTLTLVDLGASTISVGITQIQVNDRTVIKDERIDQLITLADLMVGDSVKVEFCSRPGTPIADEIEVREPDDYDLDDDGEAGEYEVLEIIHVISRRGVSLDLNGDNRTNSGDLITFSRRWKSRNN